MNRLPATVSIVIPAYNSSRTLPRALDSVFAQSFQDFEIVIVDDGSKDDIAASLAPYRDRVKIIRQSNRGPAAARNRGVEEAKGRLLAFLDADDFWHPRKLELQLSAFEHYPDIRLCWTGRKDWLPGKPMPAMEISSRSVTPQYSRNFNAIFANPYLGTPGVMMPRSVFTELGGFREDLRSAEDVDLWLRTAYSGATVLIPCPLFCRVVTSKEAGSGQGHNPYQNNLRVIDDFCASHTQFAQSNPEIVKQAKAKVYEYWGSAALTNGDPKTAFQKLFQSLRYRSNGRVAHLLIKAALRRTFGS